MPKLVSGFTLIELVIVLAIMGFIAAVTLSGNSSFNRSIVLSEQAHSVVSALRQAQSLSGGFHVEYSSTPSPYLIFADTHPDYAACFDQSNPSSPNAQVGDCRYWSGGDQLIKTFNLDHSIFISRFCVDNGSPAPVCSDSPENKILSLDIVFYQKDSTAGIAADYGNGSYMLLLPSATLYIQGTGDAERCVIVYKTGQISTPQTCP